MLWFSVIYQVVKVHPDYEVYVTSKDMKQCREKCNTANALVRVMLRNVFTKEARLACSVSGKPRVNKVTDEMERRPALSQEGIDAIIGMLITSVSF